MLRAFGVVVLGVALASSALPAQERGAGALGEAMLGVGVTARVLVVGAHPDDEDTNLIAWLSRGRHVETAYLSLTRGDGGQNVIGNELGEALGVLRTQELFAARRIDRAQQFFTRAFDFGFSKDTTDTYRHWPKDSILGDVVRVVRAFRPHVIVAVFSGTARDGHGQHQVSGLLAREAYDVSGDTARFPARQFGAPWTAHKFYRSARFTPENATFTLDAGEYSPLTGRSWGEVAGESRSQHKSQAFGALQRKGPLPDYLRREATRVNDATPAVNERSLFEGTDTTWNRFRRAVTGPQAIAALDSLPQAIAEARRAFDAFNPARVIAPLANVQRLLTVVCPQRHSCPDPDLAFSLDLTHSRVGRALQLASGVAIEATTTREVFPAGSTVPIHVAVYNRGSDTVAINGGDVVGWASPEVDRRPPRLIPPGGVLRDTLRVRLDSVSQPWWLAQGRAGALFRHEPSSRPDDIAALRLVAYFVDLGGRRAGAVFPLFGPVVHRVADPVKGDVSRPTAAAPAIAVTLPTTMQYAPANTAISRTLDVTVRSAADGPRDVRVSLVLPRGLVADSARRVAHLERAGSERVLRFRIRGRVPAGRHRIAARAESEGRVHESGYDLIDYDHIAPQRVYRPAAATLSAIDVRVPARLRVAYVRGVSDNVPAALQQLGVNVTVIAPADLARANLRAYTTVVIGPRAYDAHPEIAAATSRLLDFVRNGGTLVVQYGQYEMTQGGIMPYPITIARPHDRVTHEDAPVTIVDAAARVLNSPNTITQRDFAGWVQERSLYMPRTFSPRYAAPLRMSDPGEPARDGALLVARVGRGHYVYTTLSFFRQLPAGVPGAARLFVNLMSLTPPPPTPRR